MITAPIEPSTVVLAVALSVADLYMMQPRHAAASPIKIGEVSARSRAVHSQIETMTSEKPLVVAAFGTSLTNRAGWLRPLEKELTRCLGRQVAVQDFGHSGATSEWGIAAVGAVTRSVPDFVLIEFSVNDAAWFKGVSVRRSRENTRKIIQAIKEARPNAKIFLMTMNPAFGPRGWIRMHINAYYDLYKRLADEMDVGFIDNRLEWQALKIDELNKGIPDGLHPLPELASRILVPTIARAICGAAFP